MKFKVGFDLSVAQMNQAGTGIYVANLFQALRTIEDEIEFHVFCGENPEVPSGKLRRVLKALRRHILWPHVILPSLVRKEKVDVLHMPANITPLRLPCPTVVTILDAIPLLAPQNFPILFRTYFRILNPRAARSASKIITISENSKQDIVRILQVPPEKVSVTPLAPGPEFKPATNEEKKNVRTKYGLDEFVLTVGTLEPRKNIPLLLESVALLKKEGRRCFLVHAGGSGWFQKEIDDCMRRLELKENVRFLGFVPTNDLVALYSSSRVFVYPSSYEGFGLPVLEAMACGSPVIASNRSAIPEIVGNAALLIDPRDPQILAEAIWNVYSNAKYANELTEMGLKHSAQFSWKKCAEQTRAIYREVFLMQR